jgi:2-polyprenyl-6-methoxyphenol hydroxylase-like FAD-dependent oxidoreductase
MSECPVLVVGAGPTGLVLAVELARRGVPFHLIDRRPEPLGRDRAIVVKSRSLELLAGMGLAGVFLRRGRIIRGIDLFSGGRRVAAIGLDGLDSPFPFDLCIPEEETERILAEELGRLGCRIERGVEFAGLEQGERSVTVRLRSFRDGGRALEASWVVGTDGLHSAVREAIGDEFEGHDYPTLWGVADAHLASWHRPVDHATVQIEPPVVIAFPLRDGRWRFTFQPDAAADDHLGTIGAWLQAISPGAALRNPDQPQLFHTHARVARRYRIGRVLLAGDAAHASTPFEGHGMNTGMQDSYNLGWKLALVATGAAPETLLDSLRGRTPAHRAGDCRVRG